MAAAATNSAAAVASHFSKSNMRSKAWLTADPVFLRMSSTVPMLQISSSISHSHAGIEPIPIYGMTQKWRTLRISAAVAQEEQAVTEAVEEEEDAVGEEVKEEEEEVVVSSGEGDQVEGDSTANTKLYFGNLPYNCDSAQLAGIIQDYASPELVEVLYDRETGRSRGFAFVTMSTVEDCNAVIENLDGREFGGRILRVNFSDKPKPKVPLYPETEYKLFVGNLSWSVTSESLAEVFGEHGNVVGARVIYDGETGRSRGYGFVSYSSKSEMDAALQALDGLELGGRAIRISLAEGKKQ